MISEDSSEDQQLHNYSLLMRKVGDDGLYQWIIYSIIIFGWLINGLLSFSTPLLYLNTEFDCSGFGIASTECEHYICSHFSPDQRVQHEKETEIESLATDFGPFHCQKLGMMGFLRSSMFLAQVAGTVVFMFVEDRIGKRKMLLTCLLATSFGSLLMYFSPSLVLAVLGQYLIGFGKYPIIKFGVALVSDITKPSLASKLIAIVQVGYSLGAIIGSCAYGSLKHWRAVVLYFSLIPYTFTLIVAFIFLKDTPRYLLRKCTAAQATDTLNFIARVNGKEPLEEREVEEMMGQELCFTEVRENMGPIDLFRYASIRTVTIGFLLFNIFSEMIFFAHNVITDEIGLNPSLNIVFMSSAEILSYLVLSLFISCVPRRSTGAILAFVGILLSLALLFIRLPDNCEGCHEAILQLLLIMASRFSLNLEMGLYNVAQIEFYPASVKAVGVATSACLAAVGIVACQVMMAYIRQMGVNPFLVIALLFALTMMSYWWMVETQQMEPQDQVEEMREQKP